MISTLVGDYLLLSELGRGALGTTYLAEHTLLKRRFVLKILPEELSRNPEVVARFEKHIAALTQLDHPGIAQIENAQHVDGHLCLISEAVLNANGESLNLAQYLRKKHHELNEELILSIAKQIASALDYGHAQKLGEERFCHGALKLNNIAIREEANGVRVVLTDFGLSKVVGPLAMLSRTFYTVAKSLGSHLGFEIDTERYASDAADATKVARLQSAFAQHFLFLPPEQKWGTVLQPHVRGDIYAFGVLLYYLLLGEFPEGYFDLPSKRLSDLKWNWDLLVCRCLQSDPARRPEPLLPKIDEFLALGSMSSDASMQKNHSKPVLKPKEIVRPTFDADPSAIFQTELQIAPYRPEQADPQELEPMQTEMAVIPAGTYLRGSNQGGRDEMPRHVVHTRAFAIDIHPVSNEQFVLFLEAMGGEKDSNNNDIIRLRDSRVKRAAGKLNIESGYAKHPVVGVTWYGALAYAKWAGKRLPTEAEWEIAAYGGREDFLFPTGNLIERSQANFFSSDTTPVMSYQPNGYGLYDMAGNVYEWCQDWYDYHFYDISAQEPNNPTGPAQGVYRVLRGGCWKSSKEDMRCAHRHRNNPGLMNGTYGFRCAADVEG